MSSQMMEIFSNIEKSILKDGPQEFLASLYPTNIKDTDRAPNEYTYNTFELQFAFLKKIMKAIDDLSATIMNNDTILISVKNQKLLMTCYQLIACLGISPCLIPGLGVKLTNRCMSSVILPTLNLSDEEKYELLTECTNFFTRSYNIPVLKKIIITLHLSDYLAALIQLSFAPLKKPGVYGTFNMTKELYEKLNKDRKSFIGTYRYLVDNSFQPSIMKELLVLQSVTNPSPPMFVKRVISNELSLRLLAPSGLLSLIRCFMEKHTVDTGHDWKSIDMICRLVSAKHGPNSEQSYLTVICSHLTQILTMKNSLYITIAVACILRLNETYSSSDLIKKIVSDVFKSLDYDEIVRSSNLPGTVIMTSEEIEHKVNIFYACISIKDFPFNLLFPNLKLLFLLGTKCSINEDLKFKIGDILIKCLQQLSKDETVNVIKEFMFEETTAQSIEVIEYNSGLMIKCSTDPIPTKSAALSYFLHLLKSTIDNNFTVYAFETLLGMVIDLNEERKKNTANETLLDEDDEPVLFSDIDEKYVVILQLLSELSTFPKILVSLKTNPMIVINFIEYFILNAKDNVNDECVSIALVLLNTILSNPVKTNDFELRFTKLKPILQSMSKDESSMAGVLSKEALSLIASDKQMQTDTELKKALTDAFDNLLPVRAHGLITITKLIDAKDLETICNKHYVFCLFQEQLKDQDSYIYLTAINGIASLGSHFPEEVLGVLCKEYLQSPSDQSITTKDSQNRSVELRMKIGDVIVKVTKKLGEMAIVHKTILLNTMLCGCRDSDPLMRASALSNLAEIALVMHYKMGSIIYEVLHCIWSILESDEAIECRRAAVLVISSLIKGIGKEGLVQLKENLLPIYRTLKAIYSDNNNDSVLRLHAQIALEELNDIVVSFLFPEVKMEKQIFVLDKPEKMFK